MSSPDPLIGRKLGDYTIQDLLGRGGMARVYKGYDENLDRYAAVKVITSDFVATADEAEYKQRFQREARAIARLRHSNIVGVYQFGDLEGLYYMAMVFLDGDDLRMRLKDLGEKQERMPYLDILKMARDIASALDYAHEQGVIHRDIKPSNVMMTSTGAVLTDFGLALSTQEGTMGDTFGSAHYIAPEQAISSARAVPQSDLYSLGVVLYEAFAGQVPFDDPSVMSVALKHLNEAPPAPTLYNPELPAGVEKVLLRVLSKEPKNRYQTGEEMVNALERALGTKDEDTVELRAAALPPKPQPQPMQSASLEQYLRSLQDESKPSTPAKTEPVVTPAAPSPAVAVTAVEETAQQQTNIEAMPAAKVGDEKKRSIPWALIAVISLLAVLGIGAVLMSGGGDDDSGGDGAAAQTELTETEDAARATSTADAILAVEPSATATVEATATDTEEPTDEPTEAVTAEATVEVGTEVITEVATEEPTDELTESVALATEEPSETPTPEPTNTPEPSTTSTPEPTDTDTPEPSDTPTPEPSDTPTSEPSETPTPEPTNTLEPSTTSTPEPTDTDTPEPSDTPIPDEPPDIQLRYTNERFLLENVSNEQQNIRPLVFVSNQQRRFAAISWESVLSETILEHFFPEGCVQLLILEGTELAEPCRRYNTYIWRTATRSHFWVATAENTSFAVMIDDDVLVECPTTDEETEVTCEFALP